MGGEYPTQPDPTEDIAIEEDTDVDHAIALALNKLVDEHHITPSQVSNMSDEMLEAFLVRFPMNILRNEFDDGKGRKAGVIFSGEPTLASETLTRREHTIEMMKEILVEVKKELPGVAGFILYGSSMIPKSADSSVTHKGVTPTGEPQDIDIYPIIHETDSALRTEKALLRECTRVKRQLYPADSQVIESVGYHDVDGFAKRIIMGTEKGIPLWAWRPDVIMFIGELDFDSPVTGSDGKAYSKLDEAQTNAFLQQYLHSEPMRSLKKEKINKIRRLLRDGKY